MSRKFGRQFECGCDGYLLDLVVYLIVNECTKKVMARTDYIFLLSRTSEM